MSNASDLDLTHKIENVEKVFDTSRILNNVSDIERYYLINKIPYSLFYSRKKLIHVGYSNPGVLGDTNDLLFFPKFVGKYLSLLGGGNLLELASGRGGNAQYLLSNFTNITYTGIDLSDSQRSFCSKIVKSYSNCNFISGDFHDLSLIKDSSQDLCFVIESLCYSSDKKKVLSQVFSKLREGGYFIVIDAYLARPFNSLSAIEKKAINLVIKGMAIDYVDTYKYFLSQAKGVGFNLIEDIEISSNVVPSMEKVERKAQYFLKFSRLARRIVQVFPTEFTQNVVTGYLWADMLKQGVATYRITIFKK